MKQAENMESKGRQVNSKARFNKGWGVDLNDRPGVPKELNHENGASGHESHWDKHTLQIPKVKMLQTIERPHLTPVYGTTCPPRGLSGLMRTLAFRYSEDKLRHWVTLLAADRVDMVEGWLDDAAHGRMPMLLPRMEFRTLDKLRNPKSRTQTLVYLGAGVAAAGLAAWWMLNARSKKGSSGAAYALDPGFSTPDYP